MNLMHIHPHVHVSTTLAALAGRRITGSGIAREGIWVHAPGGKIYHLTVTAALQRIKHRAHIVWCDMSQKVLP